MTSPVTKFTSKLAGKRVLILGGTSGIGYAVAEAAIEHGAHVIISSSKQANVTSAVESLKASYPPSANGPHPPIGHVCDLSQIDQLDGNIESLLKVAAGDSKINHVVVTAGNVPKAPPLAEITATEIQNLGTVRFVSVLILAKFLPRYMDLDRHNSLTLTGGAGILKPMPGWTMTAGYGAALEGVVRGLSVDLKPLRANVVSPGAVHTPLMERAAGEQFDATMEKFKSATTVGAVAKPEDVAEAYIYLMKDRSITGTAIQASGGWLLT